MIDRSRKREFDHETLFKNKVINKIKQDIHNRFHKYSAAKFLKESSDDALDDDAFLRWIAKKLDRRTPIKHIVE